MRQIAQGGYLHGREDEEEEEAGRGHGRQRDPGERRETRMWNEQREGRLGTIATQGVVVRFEVGSSVFTYDPMLDIASPPNLAQGFLSFCLRFFRVWVLSLYFLSVLYL
jgi:hypothetical protein